MDRTDTDVTKRSRSEQLWLWLVAIVGLAIIVVAVLGGFRKAESKNILPTFGAGQAVEGAALRVTPVCAWVTSLQPGRGTPDPGKRYLVLRVQAENLTDNRGEHYLREDVVLVPGGQGEGKPADTLHRADDGSMSLQLQPRLPGSVDMVWDLPPTIPVQPEMTWGVFKRRLVTRTRDTGEEQWLQDGPGTKLMLAPGTSCVAGAKT